MLYNMDIKTDLEFLKDYEVVVFGSYASNNTNVRSDIDIAVIKPIMVPKTAGKAEICINMAPIISTFLLSCSCTTH